ncbi:MAG: hypothetical protein LBD32_02385 [Cytophagales bacterium]|jgi:hypothetical protein|nr:hypothetical protein [Cytophagales bacterium]
MKKTYTLSPLISICFFQCSGRSETEEGNKNLEEKGHEDKPLTSDAGKLENAMQDFQSPLVRNRLLRDVEFFTRAVRGFEDPTIQINPVMIAALRRAMQSLTKWLGTVKKGQLKKGNEAEIEEVVEKFHMANPYDLRSLQGFNRYMEVIEAQGPLLTLKLGKPDLYSLLRPDLWEVKGVEDLGETINSTYVALVKGEESETEKISKKILDDTFIPLLCSLERVCSLSPDPGLDPEVVYLVKLGDMVANYFLEQGFPNDGDMQGYFNFFLRLFEEHKKDFSLFFVQFLELKNLERTFELVAGRMASGRVSELLSQLFFVVSPQNESSLLKVFKSAINAYRHIMNVLCDDLTENGPGGREMEQKIDTLRQILERLYNTFIKSLLAKDIRTFQYLCQVLDWILVKFEQDYSSGEIGFGADLALRSWQRGLKNFSSIEPLMDLNLVRWSSRELERPLSEIFGFFLKLMPVAQRCNADWVMGKVVAEIVKFSRTSVNKCFGQNSSEVVSREKYKVEMVVGAFNSLGKVIQNFSRIFLGTGEDQGVGIFFLSSACREMLIQATLANSRREVDDICGKFTSVIRFIQNFIGQGEGPWGEPDRAFCSCFTWLNQEKIVLANEYNKLNIQLIRLEMTPEELTRRKKIVDEEWTNLLRFSVALGYGVFNLAQIKNQIMRFSLASRYGEEDKQRVIGEMINSGRVEGHVFGMGESGVEFLLEQDREQLEKTAVGMALSQDGCVPYLNGPPDSIQLIRLPFCHFVRISYWNRTHPPGGPLPPNLQEEIKIGRRAPEECLLL